MNWFGWIWDGASWERVCGPHSTLSACSRALGAIGQECGVPVCLQMMTAGGAPRFTPRTSGRRYAGPRSRCKTIRFPSGRQDAPDAG
jgi:hypothetical protein